MYPNGGASHLTPTTQRWRCFTSAGSGGSAGAFASALVGPVELVGWAKPSVAVPTAMRATPAVASKILFIQPLLLR